MRELIQKLKETGNLTPKEWEQIISYQNKDFSEELFAEARQVREEHYGKDIYIRGLIEFTNYCKNDCLYCGIRRSNAKASRYRLNEKEILECCETGYELGFRTFVLQGGEDAYFSDERMVHIISEIKKAHPDCAITLSVGEKSYDTYKAYFDAGADRYLLRHETYNPEHYGMLHPSELSAEERRSCLWNLKDIGYQVGTGFMVGAPYQTATHLAEDMMFLKELNPQMVGIGPFIPHCDTPFGDRPAGTLELTLRMLALIRLMLPKVLLPATTALGTICPGGRKLGMLAGANVVMPNLSPEDVRGKYTLYNNKLHTGGEAAEAKALLTEEMKEIGYQVVVARGDSLNLSN